MAKKKTKVVNRRKSRKHTTVQRKGGAPASGGGSGGAIGGLRSGFQSVVGRGDKSGGAKDGGNRFLNVATYALLAVAVAVFVGRYAC